MRWGWRPKVSYVVVAAPDEELLSAEQRGNVTAVHRRQLEQIPHGPAAAWSERALWACLQRLTVSTLTAASEVRVLQAWIDGPDAFCVVYTPPWQEPNVRIGLRRHRDDVHRQAVNGYVLGGMSPGFEEGLNDDPPDPSAFGHTVAEFDIGEPLGAIRDILRADSQGIGWWGTLSPVSLPSGSAGSNATADPGTNT